MVNCYPRMGTMIRPPRRDVMREVCVPYESQLPTAPHSYERALVDDLAGEEGYSTHVWTGSSWVRWQAWEHKNDDHERFLIEEPLRWPWYS